jgi:hypothetical protein
MRKGLGDSSLDDAVNMDVMMDNMTDVVGTLLMVLIIVQLQVNNTINNIQSSLPQVTAEEAQEARQRSEEMRQALETKQQEIASATPASEELKQWAKENYIVNLNKLRRDAIIFAKAVEAAKKTSGAGEIW